MLTCRLCANATNSKKLLYLVAPLLSVSTVFLKKVKISGSFLDLTMLLKLEHTWKETLEFAPTHRTLCNPRLSKGSVLRKKDSRPILGVWSKSRTVWVWLLEWNCLIFEKTEKTTIYTMKNNPLIIYHMEPLSYGFHESLFL